VDNIRTHAFVSFALTPAASRVRLALHGSVWPDESNRKPLWVDYIPDNQVEEWVSREQEAVNSKRDVKRWEVTYHTDDDNNVTSELSEITAPTGPRRQSSNAFTLQGFGQGMPNAPTGPRGDRRPSQPIEQSQHYWEASRQASTPAAPAMRKKSSNDGTNQLDATFPHTQTAKPKIYYMPVSKDLADRRLAELDTLTSRSWDNGRAMRRQTELDHRDRELRRYTFEDGDRIVDGGPDVVTRGGFGGGGGRGRGRRGR
jgi:hypothetical protein